MTRLLVTGGTGQVGAAVRRQLPDGWTLIAPTRADLDLANPAAVEAYVRDAAPTHILHAGAWTAVDRAESEQEAARTVNAVATAAIAKAARSLKATMLYVSTDFVFGDGHDRPIGVDEPTDPLSVYGLTKYEGECEVEERLGFSGIVVRTSWVYAAHGQNFVRTMLRLMQERDELRVVCDQIGKPTYADDLAAVCLQLLDQKKGGTWHMANAGVASWYDFAQAIYEEARARGLVTRDVRVVPIPSTAYPTPATRPRYSVLDTRELEQELAFVPRHWREALRVCLDTLQAAGELAEEL